MEEDGAVTVYNSSVITDAKKNPYSIKVGLAQMLRGGAIVEVTNLQAAKIAEDAGACAIVVAEPTRRGIRRMPDPSLIKEIKRAVSIPVMAPARVGHFVEAQILEAVGVDYIDESEILAIADEDNFINKHNFRCPFICGCQNLGEALRRVREGGAMIRIQGEVLGHGNIAETVRNVRNVMKEIRVLNNMDEDEFAAGGIVTPADAALMMQLGCDGIFVGNEVFDCADPYKRVRAIVQAVRHYNDPHVLVESSCELDEAMAELNLSENRIQHFGGN
ncbi:hypothetical protein GH714_022277 [Hevea brasiliensis]|uniref:PdxS/SNZ N-terminal domain-containing protein n=1 Tax=Hevea brasiliensis TaxID=3981 RepID=A0A6A6LIJ4_HEVBR|nr:hypothetical protein GH714_022277 [Hevea brasiliensis]